MSKQKYIMHWDIDKQMYRIQAIRSFGIVKEGDFGGYIELSQNLSHDGNAWVFGNTLRTH